MRHFVLFHCAQRLPDAALDTNQDLVYPVELTDDHVGKPIRVGHAPVAVAFSPDGHTAYVANAGTAAYAAMPSVGGPIGNRPSNTVTPINLMTNHPSPDPGLRRSDSTGSVGRQSHPRRDVWRAHRAREHRD
jgi:DNA-binding beta-propeller fold protein YncE